MRGIELADADFQIALPTWKPYTDGRPLGPKDIVDAPPPPPPPPKLPEYHAPSSFSLKAVIAEAARKEAEAAARREEEVRKEAERARRREDRARAKKVLSKEEKEALKEKRLQKLVGAVVVKYMSKYRDQMEGDVFKKHARDVSAQSCLASTLR